MQRHRFLGIFLACTLMVMGCGPSVIIEPLIGEERELLQGLATSIPDLRNDLPAQALVSTYNALMQGDMAGAWSQLSTATQQALEAVAKPRGMSGKDLFLSNRIPVTVAAAQPQTAVAGLKDERTVTALQWLLVDEIVSVRLTMIPGEKPHKTAEDETLYVIDPLAQYRPVHLKREQGRWLLEQTSFRLPWLPVS